MSQAAAAPPSTERSAEKRTHSSEENGDSNDAIVLKSQKLDNEAEAIINDVPKCKNWIFLFYKNFFVAKVIDTATIKTVDDIGAENDADEDDEGGDVEESSNAESGAEDEEGDVDEEDELGGINLFKEFNEIK